MLDLLSLGSCTIVIVATLASGVNLTKLASEGEVAREIVNASSSSMSVSSKAKNVVHC